MDKILHDCGLAKRRPVLRDQYVDHSLRNVNGWLPPLWNVAKSWPQVEGWARLQRIDSGSGSGPRSSKAPNRSSQAAASSSNKPNEVGYMDFNGSFECGNGERCDTFTVADAFTKFVLGVRRLTT